MNSSFHFADATARRSAIIITKPDNQIVRIKVDLTRERFSELRLVSFYDSKILFFQPPRELPSSLSFEVWGADILPEFPWSEYLSQEDLAKLGTKLSEPSGMLTVKGLGILSFEGLQGGYCSLTPRDPSCTVMVFA